MIASVHIADVGPGRALRVLRRAPSAPGLRNAQVALTAALGGSVRPSPDLGRAALIAFWDDDAALDGFLATHPLATTMGAGWSVRLAPLRVFGSWPGLPDDLPRARKVEHEGPAVVLTFGRLRVSQTIRFLRTTNKAENRVVGAPGLIFATGMARPPFVATCSLWESSETLSAYAYGSDRPAHPDAIAADRVKPFHHQQAFIRFRPYASQGSLAGRNPLPAAWMAPANS
ncbi:MAG: spheroidene monooxygenase [Acidimicrobiia bacterium]|nr:spheroidene monooxygenase [Acidimicrobiia bacterium]